MNQSTDVFVEERFIIRLDRHGEGASKIRRHEGPEGGH
jgi:hypothetical protein